jgi:hypothetical protein
MASNTHLVFLPGLSWLNDHSFHQRPKTADESQVRIAVPVGEDLGQVFDVLFETLHGLRVKFDHVGVRLCGRQFRLNP